MSIQIKIKMIEEEPEELHTDGDVIIKVDGRILFQSIVTVDFFWVPFLDMIEKFLKKEKKTVCGYYHINFCIDKAKKKNEIIFSIECDEKRYKLNPVHLNKKEFFEKAFDCAIFSYKELSKMDNEEKWAYEIFRISQLKKML